MLLRSLYRKAAGTPFSGLLSTLQHTKPHMLAASMSTTYNYEALKVETLADYVIGVQLNRPDKRNAINNVMWREIGEVFSKLATDPDCRSIVLSGDRKTFTAGIDMGEFVEMASIVMGDEDIARKCFKLKKIIQTYQESFTQLEKCPKPIICAINGPCVGAGVDLISATDVRYCTADAWFQVKEVDVGLAADVGTLQRLPKLIGSQSLVNELCLTCRVMGASEALSCGLVSRLFVDREAMMAAALASAKLIASNSPVAVQATKMSLLYSRDHTVEEGLQFMALLNMSMLQSEDVRLAAMSQLERSKSKPTFAKM
uniref:Delta(3,5)-Delta(2,4)-dienoyl-CoA isomerase, mitochondrial n=1 Tax=Hirondellea gigas TaxID=1518452 RepID=A0A2P2HX63_9CRUS